MPEFLPDRLEAGTHNVCGIAGLRAGVEYVLSAGCEAIQSAECALMRRFAEALSDVPELRLFRSPDPSLQTAVLSVLPARMDTEALAGALSENGVAVRAGLHCAPRAHETAWTLSSGTVRFSFSPFNTEQQIDRAAEICRKIVKNAVFF